MNFNTNSVIQYSPDNSQQWIVRVDNDGPIYSVVGWAVVFVEDTLDEEANWNPSTTIQPVAVSGAGDIQPLDCNSLDSDCSLEFAPELWQQAIIADRTSKGNGDGERSS